MNASDYFLRGDVVNLTLTEKAYHFLIEEGDNLTLPGRVIFADSLGICIVDNGGSPLTPSFTEDYYVLLPDEGDKGRFFPWRSVEVSSLLYRSEEYEKAADRQEAAEKAYAAAHGGTYPTTFQEYWAWSSANQAVTA